MSHITVHESTERGKLYSALATLTTLVIVGFLAWGIWWITAKVLGVLGILFLVAVAWFEFKNLIATKKYDERVTTSMQAQLDKIAKGLIASDTSKDNGEELTETDAKNMAYGFVIAVVGVYFAYSLITTLLIYSQGKAYAGHSVAVLGLVLTIVYALRTTGFVKNVYRTFRNLDAVPNTKGKLAFRLETYASKTRSLLALVYFGMLLAGSFGLFLGF